MREETTRYPYGGTTNPPGQTIHLLGIYTHIPGGLCVERGGPQGPPELCSMYYPIDQRKEQHADPCRHYLARIETNPAQGKPFPHQNSMLDRPNIRTKDKHNYITKE